MHAAEFSGTARYRVIRRLGAGGMGVVYEAEDTERGRRVALKTLRRADADLLYRLKLEFRALADLDHPNLVALYDLVAEGDACFFTMELIEGVDLLHHVATAAVEPLDTADMPAPVTADDPERDTMQPLLLYCDEARLRHVMAQLVGAVDALHRSGKLHRDIKPSNAIVTAEGRLVLLDLGLAIDHLGSEVISSNSGRVVGTAGYMAPEQAQAEHALGPPADWYAVGVVLYHALTGRLPFRGTDTQILMDKQRTAPPPPRAVAREVPPDLDALCVDLLRTRPEERPGSAEILRRLGATAPGTIPAAPAAQLIGRDRELQALLRAIDAGGARAVLVSGPSGIGKSALLRTFLHQVRQRHPAAVALQGRCYERETVRYRAMDPLIDNLSSYWEQLPPVQAALLTPRDAAALGQLFPVLRRIRVVDQAPQRRGADPQQQRTRAYAALRELFVRLAERVPLLLVLDDLQWVDTDTLVLLADVLRPPDPPPLLLLLSTRPEGAASLTGLLDDLGLARERIDLARLSSDDAEALARSLLGATADKAAEVAREAEGNPFLVGQLALYLEGAGAGAAVRLDQALAHRLEHLPATANEVLELVAVAGEPISRRAVARALQIDDSAIDDTVRLLRARHLVLAGARGPEDVLETYHDKIREAVVARLAPERLTAIHVVLAGVLSGEASDERLARHWEQAGERERAGEHAAAAAATAMARLEFDRAAGFYRLALQLGDHAGDRRRVLQVAEGEALAQAGRASEAADAFLGAAESAGAELALELRRRAAEQLLRGGYVDRGLTAIDEVLVAIGVRMPHGPRASLLAFLGRRLQLRLRGRRWTRRDAATLPAEALTRLDAYGTIGKTLPLVDPVRGAYALTRALLAALRLGEPARVARMLAFEAGYLAAFGKLARGTRLARAAEDEARRSGDVEALALAANGAAIVHYLAANRWREALRCQTEAGQRNKELQAAGWETDTSQLFACFSLMYLGEVAELTRRVAAHVAEAKRRGDRYHEVSLRTRLGLVWLAADDPDRAEREVVESIASWLPASRGFHVQHFYALHGRCEAWLYRGDPAAAAAELAAQRDPLRRSMLLRLSMLRIEHAYLSGRTALAVAARATAPAERRAGARLARRWARTLARVRLPVAAPLAALVRAGAEVVAGREPAAAGPLRRAIAALDAIETALYAHAARRRLGQVVGADEGARLIAEADAWMAGQGIRAPERMTAMLLPGWPT